MTYGTDALRGTIHPKVDPCGSLNARLAAVFGLRDDYRTKLDALQLELEHVTHLARRSI